MGRHLAFENPLGSEIMSMSMGDQPRGDLNQYGEIRTVIRTLTATSYGWTRVYPFGDQKIGGDNVKKLAKARLEQLSRTEFHKVTGRPSVKKGKVLSGMSGPSFTIEGVDTEGSPYRVRAYLFRGKTQRTFEVVLRDYGAPAELDPEMAFVLASIREAGN